MHLNYSFGAAAFMCAEQSTVASGTKMLSASTRKRDSHSLQPVLPGISQRAGAAPAARHGDNTGRLKKKMFVDTTRVANVNLDKRKRDADTITLRSALSF